MGNIPYWVKYGWKLNHKPIFYYNKVVNSIYCVGKYGITVVNYSHRIYHVPKRVYNRFIIMI